MLISSREMNKLREPTLSDIQKLGLSSVGFQPREMRSAIYEISKPENSSQIRNILDKLNMKFKIVEYYRHDIER